MFLGLLFCTTIAVFNYLLWHELASPLGVLLKELLIPAIIVGPILFWFTGPFFEVIPGVKALASTSMLFSIWNFITNYVLIGMVGTLAIGVSIIRNPINSLFCLIGVFLNAIILLLTLHVEFLSMIFLIVYIGAIAILFLFVIMLLNLQHLTGAINGLNKYFTAGLILLTFKLYTILLPSVMDTSYFLLIKAWSLTKETVQVNLNSVIDVILFSESLYTSHAHLFLLSGMILLSSMIGAIVLAMKSLEDPDH